MNDIPTTFGGWRGRSSFSKSSTATRPSAAFAGISICARSAARPCRCPRRWAGSWRAAVVAEVDVPGFDRASVDGFAVRADDTLGASERIAAPADPAPRNPDPRQRSRVLAVGPGTAALIATGGMVPRGADAVVMVEHTETVDEDGGTSIEIRRPASAGQFVAFAGSDLARGETVLRAGQVLTSREIGMLAAVGCAAVEVWRRPRVAIVSTGDEIIAPGEPMRPGAVYDSNAAILAAAVEEAGGIPCPLGIGADDDAVLTRLVEEGLAILRHGGPFGRHFEGCGRSVLPRGRALSAIPASSSTASR